MLGTSDAWSTSHIVDCRILDRQLSLFCFENTSKRDIEMSASTITGYAPRTKDTQRELFPKSQTFGLGQTFWTKKRPDYLYPFWYCEILVQVFHYSFETKALYPTPKHLFGIGP